ncbi:MAG: 3-phosphoshikimate 1-carboxyvinyltransferase [Gemmatimonadetes bacterium]|nr:3-phosphoshikimate 1-carboxyvinyltransferase [Gemmatimonadota bacterium]MDA1104565.1 3-phosphoshikimate 1-carboxyvinyltransferase [Gemmatimonadota bacterium]
MRVRVPGDKSLTQRALILAALADGESRLSGLLHGGDAESTAGALRALGVSIPTLPMDGSELRIQGVGLRGLRSPVDGLDLGNSGTGTRLLLGVLAGSDVTAVVSGDDSLRARPMTRVTDPLAKMGAGFDFLDGLGRLPVGVAGTHPLRSLDWPSPIASAQVKSSILLAGLTGGAIVLITEPRQSRDHTERLLTQVGVSVISHTVEGGWRVEMRDPPRRIDPLDFAVPGDASSAAFVLALGALRGEEGAAITVERVGLNPTRIAFLDVLERMGARVHVELTSGSDDAEPWGDVTVTAGGLRGTTVSGSEVPRLIDELPLVAVLGARADGVTRIAGAAELRTKESDRIAALVSNLRALGVEVEELEDGLIVQGTDRPLTGSVQSFDDHRISMAFGVLASSTSCEIEIDDRSVANVSFPGFWSLLDRLDRSESTA